MKTFTAYASMTIDLQCNFELTEAKYKTAIAKYGSIYQWARDHLDGGDFIDRGHSGDWDMYQVEETTED